MEIKTLDEKFAHELQDIYDAEHRFNEAQQQMLQHASDGSLKRMLREHIQQTEEQISNLEQIFSALDAKATRVKCHGAAGLVEEGQKTIKAAAGDAALLDCVIAGAAAKVEHYEIASYRGLVTGAEAMGNQEVLKLLRANLRQEEETAKQVEESTSTLLQKAIKAQERGA
jgi:ferritin-like metal-binding protein YciE